MKQNPQQKYFINEKFELQTLTVENAKNGENHEQISINKDEEVLHEQKERIIKNMNNQQQFLRFYLLDVRNVQKIFKFDDGKLEILDQYQLIIKIMQLVLFLWINIINLYQDVMIVQQQYGNKTKKLLIPKLINHQNFITCLIKSLDENLMISGSIDKTIKIWKNVNNSLQCQQEITVQFEIQSLSLNPSQTKFIVCGYESLIQDGSLIKLQIYMNGETDYCLLMLQLLLRIQIIQIRKALKNINCNSCFYYYQIEYQVKKLVLVKHGEIKMANFFFNNQYIFGSPWLFGKLTNDGQFLIIWDGNDVINNKGSFQIQVRKLEQIQ